MSAADLYNNTKNQPVFGIAGEEWPFANFSFFLQPALEIDWYANWEAWQAINIRPTTDWQLLFPEHVVHIHRHKAVATMPGVSVNSDSKSAAERV